MIKQMITTLVEAGLKVEFIQLPEAEHVTAIIIAPEIESPRSIASHKDPEVALAIAASRGLTSIYHRVKGGFISLEESYPDKTRST